MEQVRGGVVAHGGFADVGVDDGVDFVTDTNLGLRKYLMRTHALNRVIAAFYVGDDGVVVVGVKASAIADLAAGFGVEGSVIENDFAFVACLELLNALSVVDDG